MEKEQESKLMTTNYAAIVKNNLAQLFRMDLDERAGAISADLDDGALSFRAFGADCRLTDESLTLDGQPEDGPKGIIISLYALHAGGDACIVEPFKSFKEMPDNAPYAGAFVNRTEQALVPAVERLNKDRQEIYDRLAGADGPATVSGDFSFVVYPLPKMALCYVCYLPDEDFPAGVTCLYSSNASLFLPTDALADVGEYTTRTILTILQ